jgi:hypothetical protein
MMNADEAMKSAATKLFNMLWQTPTSGDSVPIALEQRGIELISPNEQDKNSYQLSVTVDGFNFFIRVHDAGYRN